MNRYSSGTGRAIQEVDHLLVPHHQTHPQADGEVYDQLMYEASLQEDPRDHCN
jgi:hypothetical protein